MNAYELFRLSWERKNSGTDFVDKILKRRRRQSESTGNLGEEQCLAKVLDRTLLKEGRLKGGECIA